MLPDCLRLLFLQTSSTFDFGNSWVLNPEECDFGVDEPNPCDDETSDLYLEARDLCYIFIEESGKMICII